MAPRARGPGKWIFWLFLIIWRLACGLVDMLGRTVSIVAGAVLVVVGLLLSLTIIGAIVGIPIMVIGAMLLACALRRRRGRWRR